MPAAVQQRAYVVGLPVPIRVTGREIGIQDRWKRTHTCQVIEDRRDCVVCNSAISRIRSSIAVRPSDHRFRDDPFHDERKDLICDSEQERWFAARGVHRVSPTLPHELRRRQYK